MEDRGAVAGNSLRVQACIDAGVGDYFLRLWFQGVRPEFLETPPCVVMNDNLRCATNPSLPLQGWAVLRSWGRLRGILVDVAHRIFGCARRSR